MSYKTQFPRHAGRGVWGAKARAPGGGAGWILLPTGGIYLAHRAGDHLLSPQGWGSFT